MNKMSLVEDKQIKEITTTIIKNLGSNIDEAQYEVCGFTNYVIYTVLSKCKV